MNSSFFCKSPLVVVVGVILCLPSVSLGAVGGGTAGQGSLHQSDGIDRNVPRSTMLAQGLPFQAPETPELESPKPVSPTPRNQGGGRAEQPAVGAAARDASATRQSDVQDSARSSETISAEGQKPAKKRRASSKAQHTLSTTAQSPKMSVGSVTGQPPGQAALPLSTGSSGVSSRPPLPPALPYQPIATGRDTISRTQPSSTGEGILARIPQTNSPSQSGLKKPMPPESGLPSASAIGSQESFDRFVMNSFRGAQTSSSPSPGQPQQAQEMPPSSLFGQLSQDIKQLGSGIKHTFSRIIPLGQ